MRFFRSLKSSRKASPLAKSPAVRTFETPFPLPHSASSVSDRNSFDSTRSSSSSVDLFDVSVSSSDTGSTSDLDESVPFDDQKWTGSAGIQIARTMITPYGDDDSLERDSIAPTTPPPSATNKVESSFLDLIHRAGDSFSETPYDAAPPPAVIHSILPSTTALPPKEVRPIKATSSPATFTSFVLPSFDFAPPLPPPSAASSPVNHRASYDLRPSSDRKPVMPGPLLMQALVRDLPEDETPLSTLRGRHHTASSAAATSEVYEYDSSREEELSRVAEALINARKEIERLNAKDVLQVNRQRCADDERDCAEARREAGRKEERRMETGMRIRDEQRRRQSAMLSPLVVKKNAQDDFSTQQQRMVREHQKRIDAMMKGAAQNEVDAEARRRRMSSSPSITSLMTTSSITPSPSRFLPATPHYLDMLSYRITPSPDRGDNVEHCATYPFLDLSSNDKRRNSKLDSPLFHSDPHSSRHRRRVSIRSSLAPSVRSSGQSSPADVVPSQAIIAAPLDIIAERPSVLSRSRHPGSSRNSGVEKAAFFKDRSANINLEDRKSVVVARFGRAGR